MASASRLPQPHLLLPWGAWLVAAACGAALYAYAPGRHLPASTESGKGGGSVTTDWPAATALAAIDWSRVASAAAVPSAAAGELARRFRLAGTFLEYGDETAPARRKAVLDDTRKGVQSILGEGDAIDEVKVARVFIDHVTLRSGDREEDLWMTFARTSAGAAAGTNAAGGTASGTAGAGTGAADRFGGRRVGENRWLVERESLIAYYRELMDEPERLVKVFDSLRPLYNDSRKITGYELHIEGEPEFFDAVGFREGDVVRKVNSMDMTNRRRAEFFIKQFVEGRATAFVIDLERGGQPQKLIYQTR